jgi:2-polyprenyl-6-hydroxyphenyl methylase/3-demethylubiquinone-9 3-methyltransferase
MSTVNKAEIDNFESIADQWWDVNGALKPLHKLNPTRISYIKRQICGHFERDYASFDTLDGLEILDIGCGGGLVCEPLSRLGGTITGIDAGEKAIKVAKAHAALNDLEITYKCEPSDNHDGQYDVVLALEIIEHVDDVPSFIESVAKLIKPDGIVIFSTLNKTPKSFAMGIVAAEYILRWLPRGTHDWKKFIKPSALAKHLRNNQLKPSNITGLVYNPLTDQFSLSANDIDVNYFMAACPQK